MAARTVAAHGTTAAAARFAATARYDMLPPHARQEAIWSFVDTVGVMLAGSAEPVARVVTGVALAEGPAPQATAVGTGIRTSVPAAAWIGGTLAHALDFDDSCDLLFGHPSAPVVPVCLALGEHLRQTGRSILTAYAVGVEVSVRAGGAMPLAHYEHGWHVTSTAGVLGAAAAAAHLLSLDPETTRTALGVAASMAGGLRRNFGTMVKPLHAGQAARAGVVAAQLAAAGVTADPEILEAPAGFFAVFAQGPVDLAGFERSLGNPWILTRPGIRRKLFPCCSSIHRPVEAAVTLARRADLAPGDVADVECRVMPWVPSILIRSEPEDGLQAKFSLEYSVARALTDRGLRLADFSDAAIRDPAVRDLGRRVRMTVVPPPDPDNRLVQYAEVVLRTRGGAVLTERVDTPLGHPDRPLGSALLREKFRGCAGPVLGGAAAAERALSLLERLPELESLEELISTLDPG